MVDAATVRRGDRVALHGGEWEVRDIRAVYGGSKRLVFDGGQTYLLGIGRRVPARRPQPPVPDAV